MTERELHKDICTYLKLNHESIIFTTDMSGLKMTAGQAIQAKKLRSQNGIPDIIILEPRSNWHGLLIEVKKESPYKANGDLKKSEHLKEQEKVHRLLINKGYLTFFVWELKQFKTILKNYLS